MLRLLSVLWKSIKNTILSFSANDISCYLTFFLFLKIQSSKLLTISISIQRQQFYNFDPYVWNSKFIIDAGTFCAHSTLVWEVFLVRLTWAVSSATFPFNRSTFFSSCRFCAFRRSISRELLHTDRTSWNCRKRSSDVLEICIFKVFEAMGTELDVDFLCGNSHFKSQM